MTTREEIEIEFYTRHERCITCDNPVEMPPEIDSRGPFKHEDCPPPSGKNPFNL